MRLAVHFLEEVTITSGSDPRKLSAEAEELLIKYEWPGNIRELKSIIQRAALLSDGDVISDTAMSAALGNHTPAPIAISAVKGEGEYRLNSNDTDLHGIPYHDWKRIVVMRMEREYLHRQLQEHSGNVSSMSRTMKITRPNLCRLLQRHGLVAENYRTATKGEAQASQAA